MEFEESACISSPYASRPIPSLLVVRKCSHSYRTMHLHVFYVPQFTENEFRRTCKVELIEERTHGWF